MAVVQISKIQVRRGQKNTGIGIPNLSSAEFAWAVDTQELFIGNGSVAEGAPYVGNTKILTEHDNILELAASYRFSSENPAITGSVPRSLQTKLDEYVSILDFVPKNLVTQVLAGSADSTEYFQNAFNDLFINTDSNYRKVLTIPNGTYSFLSGNLKIPSTAIIKGETELGAILELGANNIVFTTETGAENGFTSITRPANVEISNLTVSRTTGQVTLTGLADSIFDNVIFKGTYTLGDSVDGIASRESSVFWENTIFDIRTTNIKFHNCSFVSNETGVKCIQTSRFDTEITFENCLFDTCDVGVYIEGISRQGNNWIFDNNKFKDIANQAFISTQGIGTLFRDSSFNNCGNTGLPDARYPAVEMISFGESDNNRLVSCTSDRQQLAGAITVETASFVTDVLNGSSAKFVDRVYSDIGLKEGPGNLAVFSAYNKYTYIDYTLRLGNEVRAGKLTITVDQSRTQVAITDEYQYTSQIALSSGGILMTGFSFNAELKDNTEIVSGIDTILLTYVNPPSTGAIGTISYNVSYGV